MARRVDQMDAWHSAPILGDGAHRWVVRMARLAGSALCRAAWAVAGAVVRPAGRTSTLGTLPPGLGGDGAWRLNKPTVWHSAPGLGGCRHRRVVRLAGLAPLALRAACEVAGPGGLTSRPDWHARHSATRAVRWRGPAGRPAGQTCTLGNLSGGLCGGAALRVKQPAARHSAHGLGSGRQRRVVPLAGLAR